MEHLRAFFHTSWLCLLIQRTSLAGCGQLQAAGLPGPHPKPAGPISLPALGDFPDAEKPTYSYSCSAVTPCRSTIGPGETESRDRLLPSTPLPWAGDPEMHFIRNLHLAGKGSGGWAQASITVNSVTCACVGSFLSCFALRPGNTCPNKYTYTSLYCSPLSETGKQVSRAELCPPTFLRRRPNLQYLRL